MKTKTLLLLASFFLLALCAGCLFDKGLRNLPGQDATPQIDNSFIWDFGQVKKGEILKHNFKIINNSSKTLTIKDINASCGCTVSSVDKKILKPQEETFLEVSFNSQGYSGAVEQFVYVNTDSLDNPILRFIIKARLSEHISYGTK